MNINQRGSYRREPVSISGERKDPKIVKPVQKKKSHLWLIIVLSVLAFGLCGLTLFLIIDKQHFKVTKEPNEASSIIPQAIQEDVFKTYTTSKTWTSDKKNNTPSAYSSISIDFPHKYKDYDLSKLQCDLLSACFGEEYRYISSPQEAINKYAESYIKMKQKDLEGSNDEESEFPYSCHEEEILDIKPTYRKDNILTFSIALQGTYCGGNGYHGHKYFTYDLDKNKELTFNDIVPKSFQSKLYPILLDELMKQQGVSTKEELSSKGFFVEEFFVSENVYLTDCGIVFYYPPRSIAAFAFGEFNICINRSVLIGNSRQISKPKPQTLRENIKYYKCTNKTTSCKKVALVNNRSDFKRGTLYILDDRDELYILRGRQFLEALYGTGWWALSYTQQQEALQVINNWEYNDFLDRLTKVGDLWVVNNERFIPKEFELEEDRMTYDLREYDLLDTFSAMDFLLRILM